MDKETKTILGEQEKLRELTTHEGWVIIKQKFTDKILDLQNAFNIDDGDAQKMLIDLRARKLCTTILFDFWRDVEGTAQESVENEEKFENHIIRG